MNLFSINIFVWFIAVLAGLVIMALEQRQKKSWNILRFWIFCALLCASASSV